MKPMLTVFIVTGFYLLGWNHGHRTAQLEYLMKPAAFHHTSIKEHADYAYSRGYLHE